MNDLLFYALLAALLYYFFIYLPQPKKLTNSHPNKPLTQTQSTQTEPNPIIKHDELNGPEAIPDPQIIQKLENEISAKQKDIQQKEQTIIGLNNSYNKLETKTKQQIDNLKTQLKEKEAVFTAKLSQKDNQIQELKALENQVDNLTKNIQELHQEIED